MEKRVGRDIREFLVFVNRLLVVRTIISNLSTVDINLMSDRRGKWDRARP